MTSPRKLLKGIGGDKLINSFSSAAKLRETPSHHDNDGGSSSRSPRVAELQQTGEILHTESSDGMDPSNS